MKLIKPSVEIIEQQPGLDGMLKHIELCGRTCYKSQDKITDDSAPRFVEGLVKSGHGSVLEHGTVYLHLPPKSPLTFYKYRDNPYSSYREVRRAEPDVDVYVTTNYRVLVENDWLDDLKYMCEPTEYHEKRVTVRFICDIGVSREFNRHRKDSISEQSTRYCNYSKDKFGNELTFIIPEWLHLEEGSYTYNYPDGFTKDGYEWKSSSEFNIFLISLFRNEKAYLDLIKKGWKPQQARNVLPLATATELIHTTFISDWRHFFNLRCNSAAHPQARELAIPLEEEFKNKGLI